MLRQVRCECGYLARGDERRRSDRSGPGPRGCGPPDLAKTDTADDIRTWIELVPE